MISKVNAVDEEAPDMAFNGQAKLRLLLNLMRLKMITGASF